MGIIPLQNKKGEYLPHMGLASASFAVLLQLLNRANPEVIKVTNYFIVGIPLIIISYFLSTIEFRFEIERNKRGKNLWWFIILYFNFLFLLSGAFLCVYGLYKCFEVVLLSEVADAFFLLAMILFAVLSIKTILHTIESLFQPDRLETSVSKDIFLKLYFLACIVFGIAIWVALKSSPAHQKLLTLIVFGVIALSALIVILYQYKRPIGVGTRHPFWTYNILLSAVELVCIFMIFYYTSSPETESNRLPLMLYFFILFAFLALCRLIWEYIDWYTHFSSTDVTRRT